MAVIEGVTWCGVACVREHRFPDAIIALAVRWYLSYRLSSADVAEWLAERGVPVDLKGRTG